MRRLVTVLFIASLLILPAYVPDTSDGSEDIRDYWMELDMICIHSVEGFTIVNYTGGPLDLRAVYVTDGEGKVTFSEPIILADEESATILSCQPEPWMCIDSYILFGDRGVRADSKFKLADAGDDIYLYRGERVVDAFAWGTAYGDSWPYPGHGLEKIPKKTVAFRNHAYHRDDREDNLWRVYTPGQSLMHFKRSYGDSIVTPFSFPESDGSEIVYALQNAEYEVCISIYTISHPAVFSVLNHLLSKGVKVKILIEGSPVGGIPNEEIQYLAAIQKAGADIHIIKSNDGYKRYQYVHSKYAIIDERTTVITSENWSESSFSSNRGWGCIVENEECARYLKFFFDTDFDIGMEDVSGFRETYPTAIAKRIDDFVPVAGGFGSYTATVSPIIAPDYSRKCLLRLLENAQERIYSQQLYVEYGWTAGGDNPLTIMMEAGSRGVDSRLLVDVTFDDPLDSDYRDGYGLYTYYEDDPYLKVKYEDSRSFDLAHNKGVVCDGTVVIGSMNWTDNSIDWNREVSIAIESKEVSDVFADIFLDDWGREFDGNVVIEVNVPDAKRGEQITITALESSVPFGSTFDWDFDNDGDIERRGRSASWRFYEDTDCTLRVTDTSGNVYVRIFHVTLTQEEAAEDADDDTDGFLDGPAKYLPLLLVVVTVIVVKRIRSR